MSFQSHDYKRTFVAIELPLELIYAIQRFVQLLRTDLERQQLARALRFVNPQNIHLTLRFLGDTSTEQSNRIENGLQQIATAQSAFALKLQGLGCFPNSRQPSVLWTGLGGDSGQLQHLQQAVEQLAQRSGFVAEKKPFQPHITLARVERSASSAEMRRLGSWVELMSQVPIVKEWSATWSVDAISFIESTLKPTGSIYTSLSKSPLS